MNSSTWMSTCNVFDLELEDLPPPRYRSTCPWAGGAIMSRVRYSEQQAEGSYAPSQNPATQIVPASCCICLEPYNEGNHCPRVLTCGHSVCETCLRKLIGGCCAECRCQIRFSPNYIMDIFLLQICFTSSFCHANMHVCH